MKTYKIIIISAILFFSGCTGKNLSFQTMKLEEAAKTNIQLGLGYLKEGEPQRAKQKLLAAMQQAPHDPETYLAMAYYCMNVEEWEQANFFYQKALALSPHSSQAQNDYGIFLCRTGQYSMAIRYFLSAAQKPEYTKQADAYENAGLCALKIPDALAAQRYFKKALTYSAHRPISAARLETSDKPLPRHSKGKILLTDLSIHP